MKRLVSLDAYRGLVIAGMISGGLGMSHLVNNPVLGPVVRQFLHSRWEGVTFYDLIFPSFLFIVGVALPFSYAKRHSEGQSDKLILLHVIKRAVILFLLGSLRTSVFARTPLLFELSSALQPIAIAYLVSYLLLGRSVKIRAVAAAGMVLIYWLLLELVPAPGIAAGTLEMNRNLVSHIDIMLLGRAHEDGWGTILLFGPQIANLLCGTIAGDLLRADGSAVSKAKILALVGAGCLITGIVTGLFMPIIMKIWTPSYVFFTIGCSFIFLLVFYWLIEMRGYRRWAFPLVVFGMNPIALYMANSLFGGRLASILDVFIRDMADALGDAGPPLRFALILSVKWLIFYWLYRRKIFIKI